MKKFSTAIFSFLLVLLCTLQVSAADFSGNGTASNPYLIQNLSDLKTFAKKVYDGTAYEGKYFKQTTDIVVNENVIKSDGTFNEAEKSKFTSWVPAGQVWAWRNRAFEGNYDGCGHYISGIYFGSDMDEAVVGLFAQVKNSILQNITIKDSYMGCQPTGIIRDDYHGFLAGKAYASTIINCHVVNSVMDIQPKNKLASGGLLGLFSSPSKLKNCSFSGTINVVSKKPAFWVAGLAAKIECDSKGTSSFDGCTTEGTLNLSIDHDYSCEQAVLTGLGYLESASSGCDFDITECVNHMDINVKSLGFGPDGIKIHGDEIYQTSDWKEGDYNHLKKLKVFPMCGAVTHMTNCANFGDVKLGVSEYEEPSTLIYLFYVDDLKVAPVEYIYKNLKSCAFYGFTSSGWNEIIYDDVESDGKRIFFSPKVYSVAINMASDVKAKINRVLRMEKLDVEDKDNLPPGLQFYRTDKLDQIIQDANKVISSYSGYDDVDQTTYKWGVLTAGTFAGCAVPTVLGGKDAKLLGSGTKSDPYLIETESDYNLAVASCNSTDTSNKYYKLLADLDLSNSEEITAIGTSDYPFKGHFLGNGHSIIGMKAKSGSMFGEVIGGEVQDLTLLGMTCNDVDACYPLVRTLTNQGKLQNCYVGGGINVKLKEVQYDEYDHSDCYAAALCGVLDGGQIKDCYFKGKFNLDGDSKTIHVSVSGFFKQAWNGANITNSYSIFNVSATNGCSVDKVYGVTKGDWINEGVIDPASCYFMTDYDGVDTQVGTQVKSYAELNEKMASPFIKGVYNPVLPGTKSYALTDGRGLDALVVEGEGTGDMANVILHYVPSEGEDYENDRYLWQHPNLAVYNASDDAEYLINCTLDNAKDLQLNMEDAESQTIKANIHYPLAIYNNSTINPLLQMLCLPVTVQRDALPEGSKLKVVGKMTTDEANHRYISTMVECDSVPAGVPFLLEIPVRACGNKKTDTYDLVMRGKMVAEPVSTIKEGDINMETALKGTFKTFTKTNTSTTYDWYKYDSSKGVYIIGKEQNPTTSVAPFHAYAEVGDDTYEYQLIDNLLLDEESTDVASMLDTYNGKNTGVMLKRSMKKDVWNTVCLPFSLSADEIATAFGEGTKVEELAHVENSASDGATIVFAIATEMKAGKTYLVKPSKSGSLYSFSDKLITNQLASEPKDAMYNTYFKGTYAPMLLEGTPAQTIDGYSYNYFIQSNKLYYLPEGQAVALKGFRGWILIASNSLFGSDSNATMAKLKHADGSATYVRAVEYGKIANGSRIYDLQGIEHSEMQKGVNIVGGKKIMK